ncbi:unnamed protein product [Brassica rapa subsp. trilocularis]
MDLYTSRRRLSISKAIDKHPEEQIGVQEKRYRLFGAMRITEIFSLFHGDFPWLCRSIKNHANKTRTKCDIHR